MIASQSRRTLAQSHYKLHMIALVIQAAGLTLFCIALLYAKIPLVLLGTILYCVGIAVELLLRLLAKPAPEHGIPPNPDGTHGRIP